MSPVPEVVQRIRAHGGVARIHVTPFCNADGEVIGWRNVYACVDGTRFGLSPHEEALAKEYDLSPDGETRE